MNRKELLNSLGSAAILTALNVKLSAADSANVPIKLRTGRYGAVAFAVGDAIYVTGGTSRAGYQDDIEKIQPETGSVTAVDVKLIPRRYHAASVSGNRVFLVGGETRTGVTAAMECWDTASGKVEVLPDLPTPRRSLAAVVHDGFLFVIGGSNLSVPSGVMEVYDIEKKSWDKGPEMPMPRECSAALIGSRIYVPGGYDCRQSKDAMHIYSVDQGVWVKGPSLPQKVSANHVAAVGKTLVSCGDYARKNLVLSYDSIRGLWQPLADYQPARHTAAVAFEGRVYAIGGNVDSSGSYLDTIQVIQPPM